MWIDVGTNSHKPDFAVVVPRSAAAEIACKQPYFEENLAALLASGDVEAESQGQDQYYHFMLQEIGAEEPSRREARLRPLIRLLDRFSALRTGNSDVMAMHLCVSDEQMMDGSYSAGFVARKPTLEIPSQLIAAYATNTMVARAEELNYGTADQRQRFIRAAVRFKASDSSPDLGHRIGARVATNLYEPLTLAVPYVEASPGVDMFQPVSQFISSHAEQLVYLTGAAAVARAEMFTE
ncbi:MAG: hypothetical protein JWN38_1247 [Candidatus Saccharibacteria bacterium]|nr:hypothetical protein [Candidatus Saccharibacteria bacterium]